MAADDSGALAALETARTVFRSRIEASQGRVIDMAGDSVLAVFETATGAVAAALAAQRELAAAFASLGKNKRLLFRIGIHLGDVIEKADGTVYGDGVNIAARLQSFAEPGGVTLSEAVYATVRDRVAAQFDDAGEHSVKNIARPVKMYRAQRLDEIRAEAKGSGLEIALSLQDRPSIAVLPFTNMSGDPLQDYFCDGVTEDIITGLSLWRWFPVIARSSTFVYKDKSVDARRIAQDLRARYIVEGSVRRSSDRIRVSVQLIDAETGHHLWANTYDRELADVFAVQDDITRTVVGNLEPHLIRAEAGRRRRKRPTDLTAADHLYQGLWHFARTDMAAARTHLERSIALDPEHASQSWALLAAVHLLGAFLGRADDPAKAITAASKAAERSVTLDDQDSFGHALLGWSLTWMREFDRATSELDLGVELNPNSAIAHFMAANGLEFAGRPRDAVAHSRIALRLSPRDPLLTFYLSNLGLAHFVLHELDEAADLQKKALDINPANLRALHRLAAAQAKLGRIDEARATLQRSSKLMPGANVSFIQATYPFRNAEDMAFFLDGLRAAGLPA